MSVMNLVPTFRSVNENPIRAISHHFANQHMRRHYRWVIIPIEQHPHPVGREGKVGKGHAGEGHQKGDGDAHGPANHPQNGVHHNRLCKDSRLHFKIDPGTKLPIQTCCLLPTPVQFLGKGNPLKSHYHSCCHLHLILMFKQYCWYR